MSDFIDLFHDSMCALSVMRRGRLTLCISAALAKACLNREDRNSTPRSLCTTVPGGGFRWRTAACSTYDRSSCADFPCQRPIRADDVNADPSPWPDNAMHRIPSDTSRPSPTPDRCDRRSSHGPGCRRWQRIDRALVCADTGWPNRPAAHGRASTARSGGDPRSHLAGAVRRARAGCRRFPDCRGAPDGPDPSGVHPPAHVRWPGDRARRSNRWR